MNSSLNLFTQPDLLLTIAHESWQTFLSHFTASDPSFALLNLNSPYFSSELARAFAPAQSLSPRLRETLLLLESAASPENSDHLQAIARQRFPNLFVSEFHPLALALELWLAFPEDLVLFINEQHSPKEVVGTRSTASDTAANSPEVGMCYATSPILPHSTDAVERVPTIPSDCRRRGDETLSGPFPSNERTEHVAPPELSQIENPASSIEPPGSDLSPSENENGRTGSVGRTSLVSQIENENGLLNGITSLVTRYVILPKHAAETLALWIVHTYAFELRDVTTYLAVESPVRRCGKTTLLNILSRLVNRPLVAANVSPSALYRAIEELKPTLMIDEADTFLRANDELLGILNAGYHRATAYVLRVASERSSAPLTPALSPSAGEKEFSSAEFSEGGAPSPNPIGRGIKGEGSRLVRFSCWCPKIIARIGRLPETLADRCIVIPMQRKTPNDQCERLRDLDMVAVRKDLREDCAQFVEQHRDALATAKPTIPASLNDRAADIWEPLFAIADCAGGDWPTLARDAAVALSRDTRENNPVGSLLLDLLAIFAASGEERIFTRDIVEALNTQFMDRPWMENRKSQRSTEIWLSKQLRPFGICPRMFRKEGAVVRGYLREDFEEVFRRYVPGDLPGRGNDLTGGNRDNGG